ncbi:hypothetical protein D9M73_70960 [compost metagenome]
MTQKLKNNSRALLFANISAVDTSLTVDAAKADSFPVATTTDWLNPLDWFRATIEDGLGNIECVKVGFRNSGSGVLSLLQRGQEGTTARAFTAGAVVELRITAADIENAINAPVVIDPKLPPVGGIIMYSGLLVDLPANWKVCDGTNGTPNLRDRFIVGAGTTYAQGATGGSKDAVAVSHSHTASTGGESADHTHSGTTNAAGQHQHFSTEAAGSADGGNLSGSAGGGKAIPWSEIYGTPNQITSLGGSHSHTLTTGGRSAAHTHAVTVDAAGVSGADKNLPPYYALAYIMRVL